MAKQFLLSQKDYDRIQPMLRAYENGEFTQTEHRRRNVSVGHGTDNLWRKAFVKTTPGDTATVDCYLDVDTTGEEVNVTCEITGGGTKLNKALPRLTIGVIFYVVYDGTDKLWRNAGLPFQQIDITHHNIVDGKFSSLLFECEV